MLNSTSGLQHLRGRVRMAKLVDLLGRVLHLASGQQVDLGRSHFRNRKLLQVHRPLRQRDGLAQQRRRLEFRPSPGNLDSSPGQRTERNFLHGSGPNLHPGRRVGRKKFGQLFGKFCPKVR